MAVRKTKQRRQQRAPGRPAKDAPLRRNDVAEGVDMREVEKRRALFISHKNRIERLRNDEETVRAERKAAESVAKNDGFKLTLFAVARNMRKARGEVTERLTVAHWMGDPLGLQLALFAKAIGDVEPRIDPFEAGKTAGHEGVRPTPPDHLGPEDHDKWMQGYHEATASRVREKMQPLEDHAPAAEVIVEATAMGVDVGDGLDPGRPL